MHVVEIHLKTTAAGKYMSIQHHGHLKNEDANNDHDDEEEEEGDADANDFSRLQILR